MCSKDKIKHGLEYARRVVGHKNFLYALLGISFILAAYNLYDLENSTGNMMDEGIEYFSLIVPILSVGAILMHTKFKVDEQAKQLSLMKLVMIVFFLIMCFCLSTVVENYVQPPETYELRFQAELSERGVTHDTWQDAIADETKSFTDAEKLGLDEYTKQWTTMQKTVTTLEDLDIDNLDVDGIPTSEELKAIVKPNVELEEWKKEYHEISLSVKLDTFDSVVTDEMSVTRNLHDQVNRIGTRYAVPVDEALVTPGNGEPIALPDLPSVDVSEKTELPINKPDGFVKEMKHFVEFQLKPDVIDARTANLTQAYEKVTTGLKTDVYEGEVKTSLEELGEKVKAVKDVLDDLQGRDATLDTLDFDKANAIKHDVLKLNESYIKMNSDLDKLRDSLYSMDDLKQDLRLAKVTQPAEFATMSETLDKLKALEAEKAVKALDLMSKSDLATTLQYKEMSNLGNELFIWGLGAPLACGLGGRWAYGAYQKWKRGKQNGEDNAEEEDFPYGGDDHGQVNSQSQRRERKAHKRDAQKPGPIVLPIKHLIKRKDRHQDPSGMDELLDENTGTKSPDGTNHRLRRLLSTSLNQVSTAP